jgi:hypothetical protein
MAIKRVAWQTQMSKTGEQTDGSAGAEEYFVIESDVDTDSTQVWGTTDPVSNVSSPVRGVAHPTLDYLICVQTQYMPVDQNTRRVFQCRANYSDDFDTNPLNDPPDIQWNFSEDGQKPYFLDCTAGNGSSGSGSNTSQPSTATTGPKRVTNSAGELFEDYLTRAGGTATATFSVNVLPAAAQAMAPTIVAYAYPVTAISSDAITFDGENVAAGQTRLKGGTISGIQKQRVNGEWVYWRTIQYAVAFKSNWDDVVDDRGFNATWAANSDGSTLLKEIIKGAPPVKPDRPWPLDGMGNAKPNATDAPAQLTFKPYPQLPFSVFHFA